MPHLEDGASSFDYILGSARFAATVRTTRFGALDLLPVYDAAVDRMGIRADSTGERERSRTLAEGFHTRFGRALEALGPEPELALARRVTGVASGRRDGALAADPDWTAYDFAFIDLPPQQVFSVPLALAAADAVVVPTKVEAYAMRGFSRMLDLVADVRDSFNPSLRLLGALPTFAQYRTQTTSIYLEAMQRASAELRVPIFSTVVPYRVQAIAAAGLGLPLHYYPETKSLAAVFDELADEVETALAATPED